MGKYEHFCRFIENIRKEGYKGDIFSTFWVDRALMHGYQASAERLMDEEMRDALLYLARRVRIRYGLSVLPYPMVWEGGEYVEYDIWQHMPSDITWFAEDGIMPIARPFKGPGQQGQRRKR